MFCPHSVLMCFVWISEQTAIISLYSIKWLVCIIEKECVYCAVRTEYVCVLCGSENKQRLFSYTVLSDGFYNRDGVCLLRGTDWVCMCFVWIWEQTAIISLYSINGLVFITETENVYCAVRTERLNTIHLNSFFQMLHQHYQYYWTNSSSLFSQNIWVTFLRDIALWSVQSAVSSLKRLYRPLGTADR
jgi:hypothetical protein